MLRPAPAPHPASDRWTDLFLALLDASEVGIAILGDDGTPIQSNAAFRAMAYRDTEGDWSREIRRAGEQAVRATARCRFCQRPGVLVHLDEHALPGPGGGLRVRAACAVLADGNPAAILLTTRTAPDMPGTAVLGDRHGLTPRQARVARLLALGMSNGEIATTLSVSVHTVRHHVEQVLSKLRLRSRAGVAAMLMAPE